MTVIEIGCMVVKPGLDIMDPSKPEGRVLPGVWNTVTTSPGGPSRVCWGLESEDPSRVWAFFDWDSVKQHQDFAKTLGPDAVKDIPTICVSSDFVKHAALEPSTDALTALWVEVTLAYFTADISQADKEVALAQMERVLAASGIDNRALGWGVENDFPLRGGDGQTGAVQTGAVLMGVVGWLSREEQAKFRETDAYRDSVELLERTPGLIGSLKLSIEGKHIEREIKG
ncbi:hypothetical protein B0T11DRAFT_271189 [Plectosphaerella cucumerina]|uniref:ABM domain-containing protein n=1 Tax=Plectosphaerella cucumerina TaxID=40658 RepID=A0A8K0X8G5_9PEZI|nr:hypothetical protein B0T11DRAFT_271189 [Plectosphaerella cucumerina]